LLYSPYKYSGININFEYDTLKECLLGNYKEYVEVYSNNYYYNYFIKFIDGKTFGEYGESNFPCYSIVEILEYINTNYKKENKSMSNGGLTASIRKFIEMMKNNKLQLYNYSNSIDIKNIMKYYNVVT
jgi:hypothetical protein